MKVTITFDDNQAELVRQFLARTPYRSAEEWISDLVAGVLMPYAPVVNATGPIKTILDQKAAIEASLRNAVKPVAVIEEATQSEASRVE